LRVKSEPGWTTWFAAALTIASTSNGRGSSAKISSPASPTNSASP
jgi:hypothetical protein